MRIKCGSCLETVQLSQVKHPRTGEPDQKVLWLMCECKGRKIGEKDDLSLPENWSEVKQH